MAKKKTKNGRTYTIVTLISIIVLVPIAYLVLCAYGERSGVEFSPDDFSMRRFDYQNLPLINWTRRGIRYTSFENETAKTLVDKDWIRDNGRLPKRWHLVSESGGRFFFNGIPAECDARFLTDYFDVVDAKGKVWILQWNEANPKSAKIYWPLIAEMARQELYLPIPGLMEFVLNYPKPDEHDAFEADLLKQVSEAWYQAGITDQLKDSHQRAIERFDMAMAKGDGHPKAQQAKETSQSAAP